MFLHWEGVGAKKEGKGKVKRIVRLRIGTGMSAVVGVIPFNEAGFRIVTAEVKKPVTVPFVGISDSHELMALIARKALGNFGVKSIQELKVDLAFRLDPQVQLVRGIRKIWSPKIQKHVGLFCISGGFVNPGEHPVRELVLVCVDVQKEGFFGHVKRVVRQRRFRVSGRG
jgi:hypothetical protein